MAKDSNKPEGKNPAPQKVQAPRQESAAALGSDQCKAEDCKKKSSKFGFCADHYELYMAGVLRGDGKKPSDYAEKLHHHEQKSSRKVA